jgi:hypothetical protein
VKDVQSKIFHSRRKNESSLLVVNESNILISSSSEFVSTAAVLGGGVGCASWHSEASISRFRENKIIQKRCLNTRTGSISSGFGGQLNVRRQPKTGEARIQTRDERQRREPSNDDIR